MATYVMLFNEANKDQHELVTTKLVGGPGIVFSRHHEADGTKLRRDEYVRRPNVPLLGYLRCE